MTGDWSFPSELVVIVTWVGGATIPRMGKICGEAPRAEPIQVWFESHVTPGGASGDSQMFGSGLVEGPAGFDLSILLVLKILICAGSGGNPKVCL